MEIMGALARIQIIGTVRDDKNIHTHGYLWIKSVMDTERIV
jgi:hypothetical protein